ncbi:hypothetical protein [Saccharothrix violaceirubra]|uniref:Uncharacterized protein n=1 Tax=Saccharothrix violaceirubra TaxID=413306 RepID=A0A7W7WVF1_9PSEU|nr:hypothetical protein [Saccharothrix violaceirubra]MBB4965269.1 hypothetical protein [Saccharothrix violaceirubra]
MSRGRRIAAAWSSLSARELTDQIRQAVKSRDADVREAWEVVRADQVLAARVRGALAGLRAEFRGHRDEAMWLLWISQAQQRLNRPVEPAAPEPEPEVADVVEEVVEVRPPDRPEPAPRADRPSVPTMVFQEPSGR